MALKRTKLTPVTPLLATGVVVYTNAAGQKAFVRGFTLHSLSKTVESVQIWWVPAAGGPAVGTVANGNRVYKIALSPEESYQVDIPYPFVLTDQDESIQASCLVDGAVNIALLGDKDA